MTKKKIENPSELRMDLVSNDWVIIATCRAKRPEAFIKKNGVCEKVVPKKDCPFCQKDNISDVIARKNKQNGSWHVISIPNKYPALSRCNGYKEYKDGPNRIIDGFGYHEVIITSDHERQMAQFDREEMKLVVDMYQDRYRSLIQDENIKYVSIFHNHGKGAGASVAHPHSQIIAIPVLDPTIRNSLEGADNFYLSRGKCVYCTMIDWDLKNKERIIYENEEFVVLCPFASQASFEIRVYPKKHEPHFESMSDKDKEYFADALRVALLKLYKGLNNPSYNFYIHTAPSQEVIHENYHWHLNILPKTATWAGFELGAGIEINTIKPEDAAKFLRQQ